MCSRLMSSETVFTTENLATFRVSAHVRLHGIVHLLVLHEVVLSYETFSASDPTTVKASTRMNVLVRLHYTKSYVIYLYIKDVLSKLTWRCGFCRNLFPQLGKSQR